MKYARKVAVCGLFTRTLLSTANLLAAPLGEWDRSEPSGDVELDPTAYVLDGYSVHAGINQGHFRLDLGAFALAVPEFVHGNPDYHVAFHGYGAKFQYFFAEKHSGGFVGVDVGHSRLLAERKGTDLAETDDSVSLGLHAGYRLDLFAGFYLNAWIGVGYAVGAEDITLAGKTFEAQPLLVFPAIHLGYAFR
ncbi:MAG: hypothetical protein H6718_19570 [Polyangiaceae bacterium]|nr:hypothetical protein [Polyangiaceae bacterium]MCB9605592.1 hypothetical protein [Polyangiaceae bacterium]